MMACSMDKEDLELIEFLLDQGIDVNRRDADGLTAFCYAVRNGRSKVIKFLLDRDDMDPNLPDVDGHTPLFYAVMEENLSGLLLRKKGIYVNTRDYACTGVRPEDHAADFVRLLLSHHDTNPNIVDNNGVSVLSKVIELGRTQGRNEYSQRIECAACSNLGSEELGMKV